MSRRRWRNSRDLAVQTERFGYHRFWLAEHHNMPGIASAATALCIRTRRQSPRRCASAPAGSCCRTTRRSSSPSNSARLKRSFLGALIWALAARRAAISVWRGAAAHACRRRGSLSAGRARIAGFARAERSLGRSLRAVPGEGANVPLWLLGSSTFGAQLAAALGLPFAFASHFAPAQMMSAIEIYRATFQAVGAIAEAVRHARL
jgi:hypothetical protein